VKKGYLLCFCFLAICLTATAQKKKSKFSIKTQDELLNYLNEYSVDYDKEDLMVLNDVKTFLNYLQEEKITIPSAYFFNKNGYRVSQEYTGDRCGQVISRPEEMNMVSFDENDSINEWLKDYTFFFEGESFDDNTEYDSYVIICWASFLHKKSNRTSFNWYKSIKENKDLKIKPILLSLDLLSDWEMTDLHRKAFGLQ